MWRAFAAALALFGLLHRGEGAAPARTAPVHSVKAAYLLLFARYVTWPDSVFTSPSSPIVVGIIGHDPFGKILPETFQGSKVHGRPLEIRRFSGPAKAGECHMAFISGREGARLGSWLQQMQGLPILTVTELPGALEKGATVNFVVEGNRLRYEASLAASEASGLKIASPMLVSARRIHRKEAP